MIFTFREIISSPLCVSCTFLLSLCLLTKVKDTYTFLCSCSHCLSLVLSLILSLFSTISHSLSSTISLSLFSTISLVLSLSSKAAMAEWLSCLTHTHKVLCTNLGATRHRITLDKLLTAVCLGSPVR